MKILLVDDNAAVRKLIRRVIAGSANEILECSNGEQALAAYCLLQPDVVLMDIEMPGLDGISATRRIVAKDTTARVIMVTDYDDADLRRAATDAGASGYVIKENITDLTALISALGRGGPDVDTQHRKG
jgi:CheY-like chemotaxis protein